MRMWMVPPSCMCRKHLLGEHVELHMFLGSKHQNLEGYLKNGLFEPAEVWNRHEALVKEMQIRGYQHKSPLSWADIPDQWHMDPTQVLVPASWSELVHRCSDCAKLYEQHHGPIL